MIYRAHPAFEVTKHRPWPVPQAPWIWRQTWNRLLFAHWPVPASSLRPFIPPALTIEECEGSSWVTITPFSMTGVALRGMPDLPWVSHFPEMNFRTYVRFEDKPGIWFFSLDASNSAAVLCARSLVHLPYHWASMQVHAHDGRVRYTSRRLLARADVAFRAEYGPDGPVHHAARGTLEHFLTERYCLYTTSRSGEIERLEIHHWPWPLQPATAHFHLNAVAGPQGVRLPSTPPLLQFAERLEVVGWGLEKIIGSRRDK